LRLPTHNVTFTSLYYLTSVTLADGHRELLTLFTSWE